MGGKQINSACVSSCWFVHVWIWSRLWLFSLSVALSSAQGGSSWSPWFDVEPQRGVDNQSLALIREVFHYDCPYDDILETECRKVDAGTFPERYPDGGLFTQNYWHEGVFLRVPCDSSGIVCVDSDQAWAHAQAERSRELLADATLDSVEQNLNLERESRWPILSGKEKVGEGGGERNSTESGEVVVKQAEEGRQHACSDYEIRYRCDDRGRDDAQTLGPAQKTGSGQSIMGNITTTDLDTNREIQVPLESFPCLFENCTNNTPPPPAFENPLKVNGGFIAMAAGLSVVIPLVCVLIIQLRRAKREEAERRLAEERARNGGSTSDGGESGTFDSPPSYEQLFGPDYVPAAPAVLHSRHNSLDMLIEETETGSERRAGISSSSTQSSSSSSNSGAGGGVSPVTVVAGTSSSGGRITTVTTNDRGSAGLGGGPHNNMTFTGSAMSVLSETDGSALSPGERGGLGPDPSLSESEGYVSAPEDSAPPTAPSSRMRERQNSEGAGSNSNSNTMSLDSGVGLHGSTPPSPSLSARSSTSNQTPSTGASSETTDTTSSQTSASSSSSSSSPATTTTRAPRRRATSTSSELQHPPPPPDYGPPPPPPPPPLPLTPPPPFTTSETGETSGQFRLHAVQRRYPNMHLSIQDFIATLRGQQEQERQRRQLQAQRNLQEQIETYGDAPPPTYEEALRILAKAKERERSTQNNK